MTSSPSEDDVVHLSWCLTGSLQDDAMRTAVALLSAEERQRYDRFHFEHDRREYALAHALLRGCLSECDDRLPDAWAFTVDANGKPIIEVDEATPRDLVFNLSHTAGLVACAVGANVEIGVDVERLDHATDALTLSNQFFSSLETDALRRLNGRDRQHRFIEIWTLKEAFVKAIGEGLSCPFNAFSFRFGEDNSLDFECARPTQARAWSFLLFAPSPDHRMAVAIGTKSLDAPALFVNPVLTPVRKIIAARPRLA